MKAKETKSDAGSGPKTLPRAIGRPSKGTKEAIVQAAVLEFAEEGFGGARIERISKRACTSDRMLYYYFEGKDMLFQAALEKVHADMISAESALDLAQLDPRDGLKRLIAFMWRYFLQHPEFISLVNTENMYGARHATASENIRSNASPQLKIVEDLLTRGVAAGYFRRDVTVIEAHLTIVSLCYYYLSNSPTMSNFLGFDMSHADARDAWLGHITRVVIDFLTHSR